MLSNYLNTAIGRLRLIGILEGISYLLLLGIGMPLKRMAGIPEPQKYIGWIHGILFILLVFAIAQVFFSGKLSFSKCVKAFVASLIPFGTFLYDRELKKEQLSKEEVLR